MEELDFVQLDTLVQRPMELWEGFLLLVVFSFSLHTKEDH